MSKVIKSGDFNYTITDSLKRITLNYTDIELNSNKTYNAELILASDNNYYLMSSYGRTGGSITVDYRLCKNQSEAESELEKLIKSKTKKGYIEVKLVKSDIGSEIGKSKVENTVSVESLKNLGIKIKEENPNSKLHSEVANLVRTWFGITQDFVELNLDTKKCPLGQLSLSQIEKAKEILEEARRIVHNSKDIIELNKLTNSYYSNIPHNFGYRKINADSLRLDDDTKINAAFDILDVFADSKDLQSVLSKKTAVDSQYESLKCDLEWLDPESATWKWIDNMLHGTKANNHHFLGKLKIHKIFKVNRHNEEKLFLNVAEKIAKECGKSSPSETYSKYVKVRPDIPKEYTDLYNKANINPGWHGTRRCNMVGINTKGLLIRPSGVVHAGSAFGDGIYWATNSTKSINYCDVRGSYWNQGDNKTAYLFLGDVAFGNYKMANGSHFYSASNIKPNHSVFAKAGYGGVINDEIITYYPSGPEQQHCLRYIIEFETLVK